MFFGRPELHGLMTLTFHQSHVSFLVVAMTGLRHIAVLKLVGTEAPDMGGVLELYPINGKTSLSLEVTWFFLKTSSHSFVATLLCHFLLRSQMIIRPSWRLSSWFRLLLFRRIRDLIFDPVVLLDILYDYTALNLLYLLKIYQLISRM